MQRKVASEPKIAIFFPRITRNYYMWAAEPFWERRNDLENTKPSNVVKADPPEDALETFVSLSIRMN